MQQILCPYCGKPVAVDEAAQAAQQRHELELEIQRLQSELEQLCARFELQLQQKDGEIALYKEMVERLTAGVSPARHAASSDGIEAAITEIDRSVDRLFRAKEALRKLEP